MKKIFIFSVLISIQLLVQAQSLTIDDYTICARSQATISVKVSAEQNNFVGTGMVWQLAEGFAVTNDTEGHLASSPINYDTDHIIRASINSEDRLKVAIYSPTNSLLNLSDDSTPTDGGEGQSGGGSGGRPAPKRAPGEEESDINSLCSVQVIAPNAPGTYNCNLTNIEFATSDYGLVTIPDISFQITVIQRGDVNNDGRTDVADLTAIVNYIQGNFTNGMNLDNADFNNDGQITEADIAPLINIILGKRQR